MLPSSEPAATSSSSLRAQPEYSPEERSTLLQLAHEAILSSLENRQLQSFTPSPHLSELRGAFTTLYVEGKLRGCVGYPLPIAPLYRTIIETARAAAFDDPRFVPLALGEASGLCVSISVLSPLAPIRPEEVEIGRHGLLISRGIRRGLLLPQVPVEHGWDRITFLEQACYKAGLPPGAWREDVTIEAFTAEIFSDPGCQG
jgi:AmmeMemoRadiSam system protein A